MFHTIKRIILIVLIPLAIHGCDFHGNSDNDETKKVTLNIFTDDTSSLQRGTGLIERLSSQFPDFSFRYYSLSGVVEGTEGRAYSYEEYRERDVTPDLILERTDSIVPEFIREGEVFDLSPLLQGPELDTARFQPELMDHIRAWSDNGEILALPYRSRLFALYYDKDQVIEGEIPMLRDGMTWDEVVSASLSANIVVDTKRVWYHPFWQSIEAQFRLLHVDTEKKQAAVDNENWTEALQLWSQLHIIKSDSEKLTMIPDSTTYFRPSSFLNWDMVSYPIISDHPDWGPNGLDAVVAIGPEGKHPNEAMQVLTYLVSDEFQLKNARLGYPSPLVNPDMRTQFGADNSDYRGKNIEALFALPYTKLPSQISKYERSTWVSQDYSIYGEIQSVLDLMLAGRINAEQAQKQIELGISRFLLRSESMQVGHF